MKEIRVVDIFEMIHEHHLTPGAECWRVDLGNGQCEKRKSKEVFLETLELANPVVRTDDDGVIRIVTVDVYYDYPGDDWQSGRMIRFFLHRKKRIQSVSFSNGVGAPTRDTDCIPTLY